jgi:CheY-like chemotaxis protein
MPNDIHDPGADAPAPLSSADRRPVLVADDNASFRLLVVETLGFDGIEVIEAETGDEIVSLARQTRPSLLLLDVRLPRRSGLEAYAELRRDSRATPGPAVFVTTGPSRELERRAELIGALALLDKFHLRITDLRRLAAAALDGAMIRSVIREIRASAAKRSGKLSS